MRKLIFLIALMGLAFALPQNNAEAQTASQLEGVIFSEVEKRIIHRWLGDQAPTQRHEDTNHSDNHVDDDDDNKGKGKNKNKGRNKGKGKDKKQAKHKAKAMPKGLAKRKELPHGLAKKQKLPRGLAKRRLPPELERELPPTRPGTSRIIVDEVTVLLVETGTNIVLDIIEDALFGKNK